MKRLLSLLIALVLIALPAYAPAQEAAAPDASGAGLTDGAALEMAQNASRLYELIARGFELEIGATGFDGEPDAATAWVLAYEALEQGAVEGMNEDGIVAPEGVSGAYDAIFASGALPAQPEDFTLLQKDGDAYRQTSDPGEAVFQSSVLNATVSDGVIQAEVAVMAGSPDTPADLSALFSASLLPDDQSPFGVKLAALFVVMDAPAMTGAEATATLEDYKGITYAAQNALDGDYATCWAYSEKQTPGAVITLTADEPQTARGIRITPAYAKTGRVAMTNNRVKTFRVELSDGATFDFAVEPDLTEDEFSRMASFAFDKAHEITWISVQVTGVYPGEKYADTCLSEIALF